MATYDIHFQLLPPEQQSGASKFFTFGYKSAVGIRGPQKLINRWLKCLMTPKGSDPFDADVGTGFSGLLGSNVYNFQDLMDAVVLFVEDCNEQLARWDRKHLPPDDERLLSATLVKMEPRGTDGFDAWVQIQNVAGTTATLTLPSLDTRE
jgi:hypothetical protein